MNTHAIRVDNLSKSYRIRKAINTNQTLRDKLAHALRLPVRKIQESFNGSSLQRTTSNETFWALRDVSFEIARGDVIGIIGRNGAGKSTLLKLLSRITAPTTGRLEIVGTMGSLLEVGTGFHRELTGRENIYLNGAILGMRKAEINAKFDEMVNFAGVEQFIDTPVKHYSSGMYLRLAFAVAASLEPDILLVDEVLAVGDAAFQKKCMGKMNDVAKHGHTVLLVSHNLGAIGEMCNSVLWLDQGRIVEMGPAKEIVAKYLREGVSYQNRWSRSETSPPVNSIAFWNVQLTAGKGFPVNVIDHPEPIRAEVEYEVMRPTSGVVLGVSIRNAEGFTVLQSCERDWIGRECQVKQVGMYKAVCEIPGSLLRPGVYHLGVFAWKEGLHGIETIEDVVSFEVTAMGCYLAALRKGVVAPKLEWTLASSFSDKRPTIESDLSIPAS